MEFYHILNRGVDKRAVYESENDYVRFIHDMFTFNDSSYVDPHHTRVTQKASDRELIVQIHAFCLMPNHYHMLVSEVQDGGIPLFMKKINKGYTQYFNAKYERSGALWQGKYKKVLIERDAHFMFIPYYIHLNALDITNPEWRRGEVTNVEEALQNLLSYRWSSYRDYVGIHNFSSVITTDLLGAILGTKEECESQIEKIITEGELASKSNSLE